MSSKISDKFTVSPIHLFFLMYVCIVDVNFLNFQRKVVREAGQDAWVAAIIVWLCSHILVWMMFKILSNQNPKRADFVSINLTYFGKFIGACINHLIILYFVLGALVAYRSYLESILVLLFPTMNLWPISIVFLVLFYYAVSGGFQTVAGICFWAFLVVIIIFPPLLLSAIPNLHPQNILPFFNHTPMQILKSSHQFAFSFLGAEVLLGIYPYIQTQAKAQKWAHIAIATSGLFFLVALIMSLMYFPQSQLFRIMWPTLKGIGIIELPLLQRVEYLVLSIWVIKTLASVSVGLWIACHSLKTSWRTKPSNNLIMILILFVLFQLFINDPEKLTIVKMIHANVGFYFAYIYIPIMFVITMVSKKFSKGLHHRS
ncbi:GerAB/ArcD/ProY family transporter [Paenibacillus sp. OV219]|uniref:GerAB/ArcD/ProY family transporter n=1 Tax=Paenibacillus sp. OV219 TaxID=1884377 RepID=UPI0008ABC888|nr:GerAB/ArcD/ProY family transporter [Paenibacillus sp. OV219]SEO01058.1 spore germination protein (amino acid permease) [Paenibacillus sp. OV219]